jgi:hypothetical protein
MSDLGQLVVSLAANTAEFTADLGRAAHLAEKNFKSIERAGKIAAAAFGTVAVAAAASAAAFLKTTIDTADGMGKLAQKTGVGVEALSALKYAASLSDVSVDALSTGLKHLNKSIDDNDPAFKRLGIDLVDATGKAKSTEQVLREVADRFSTMKDGAGKTALAMDLLGKSGSDLIPLINGGSKALDEFTMQAQRAGVVITDEVAKAAEDFNDNVTKLTTSLQGMAITLAGPVINSLGRMTNEMMAAEQASGSWLEGIRTGFNWDSVGEEIIDLTSELERLRLKRKEFADLPPMPAEAFGLPMGESGTADMDQAIARIEQRLEMLQKVRAEINKADERGTQDAPAKEDKSAMADAAKRAAEAERELQRAMRDSAKAFEDMARVELESGVELRQLQAKWAGEEAAELAKRMQDSQAQIENLRTSLMTEEEVLVEHYLNKQDQLAAARDLEVISQEEHDALMQELETAHWEKLRNIRVTSLTELEKFSAMSYGKQTKTIFSELASITAGVAQHNRALFEINKVAGIANAVVNAYEGISLTMAKYPYPINIAMAAAHGLAAFAQVKAIAGSQFGSGGGAPSIAGSTAATPVSPVESGAPGQLGGGQTTIVQLSGHDSYSDKNVRQLLTRIKEVTDKGGKVVLA